MTIDIGVEKAARADVRLGHEVSTRPPYFDQASMPPS